MSERQAINLEIRGLYTSPNNLSGIPQGALEVADNLVINTKSLAESRRGQTQYGTPLVIGSDQINKLFNYSSSLIANYANKMAYDSGSGVWIDYSGTYTTPDLNYKMRSLEALKNFYFTSGNGIFKIDALTSTPRQAGVVRALGGTGTTTGSSGFLVNDSSVAYRIVWGYRDANNNLILGAPSQRIIVSNSTGGTRDVLLTFQIPATIETTYFYQIYRSNGTAAAIDEPSDELQLVVQGSPTSGEITAKEATITDSTPYSLMRAALYTNPSQEGIANANTPPPYALDMDVFKGCAFYANVRLKQSFSFALLSVDTPAFGFDTQASDTTINDPVLTNVVDTANIRVGMRIVGSGIPANTYVASVDSATQITMSEDATVSDTAVALEFQDRLTIAATDYWGGSAGNVSTNTFEVEVGSSPGVNINQTAINLVELINKSTSNTSVYAYYISGLEDLPGQILIEERSIGGSAFYATSTYGASFSPTLPTSGTTVASSNDARQNRVMISKQGQVESVPVYRFFDVGSANFAIQRVVALRDGIFFFKPDGIYRLSGETFESFTLVLLDNTVVLKVPESAVAFNNQVFCFTTQGVCAVSDSGVQIMSVPIENSLLELSSEQYTNFVSSSFGVAYESARLYMFFTVTRTSDEFATQAFIYNALTDSWTRWIMNRTCGIVSTASNKLFMGQADTGQVMIERKNYTSTDFADEQYNVTIDDVISDTQLELADASLVVEGMTIVQGDRSALILEIQGDILTIVETEGFTEAAAIVYEPILNKIQWAPIDAENPGILKQYSEITLFFRDAAFREATVGFSTNVSPGFQLVTLSNSEQGGWGTFPWGEQAWGGEVGGQNVIRTYVPREKQRTSWIIIFLQTEQAFTGFSLQGISLMFNVMSSRVR